MRLPVLLGLWGLLSGAGSVRLRLEPDSDQFFSLEMIILICEGQTDRWNLKRTTRDKTAQTCGRGQEEFGQIESSSCVVATPSPSDSGSYWCQDGSGTMSQEVHLSVTGGDLILDSPVLPVETGSDVTLHCRVRRGSGVKPEIFRNSSLFQPSPDWTIFNVSRSDQGFYSCSGLNKSGLRVTSEERWLRVKDPSTTPPPTTSSSLSPTDSSSDPSQNPVSVSVQVGAAVGCLALLVLVLVMVLLRRQRQTGSGGPEAGAAEVTYADVTVRRADRPAPAHEEDTVYSGVRTHAAGSEVTYGQVVVKPKKKKKRVETSEPWADPDVVYSSVRVRNSAGT